MQSQNLESWQIAEKKDKMVMVSIIVPVYNAVNFACEVIYVDDNSPDDCGYFDMVQ